MKIFLPVLAIFFFSCDQHPQKISIEDQSMIDYTMILAAIKSSKTQRLGFFDEMAKVLDSVKVNESYIADSIRINKILHTAIDANKVQLSMIQTTSEPDKDIPIRKIAEDFTLLLDSLYHHQFPVLISLSSTKKPGRKKDVAVVINSFYPHLKSKGQEMILMQQRFAEKYHAMDVTDDFHN